jgi:hypothetical protein
MISILKYLRIFFYLRKGDGIRRGSGGEGRDRWKEGRRCGEREWRDGEREREGWMERERWTEREG